MSKGSALAGDSKLTGNQPWSALPPAEAWSSVGGLRWCLKGQIRSPFSEEPVRYPERMGIHPDSKCLYWA